jgi:hypothetical protein
VKSPLDVLGSGAGTALVGGAGGFALVGSTGAGPGVDMRHGAAAARSPQPGRRVEEPAAPYEVAGS